MGWLCLVESCFLGALGMWEVAMTLLSIQVDNLLFYFQGIPSVKTPTEGMLCGYHVHPWNFRVLRLCNKETQMNDVKILLYMLALGSEIPNCWIIPS